MKKVLKMNRKMSCAIVIAIVFLAFAPSVGASEVTIRLNAGWTDNIVMPINMNAMQVEDFARNITGLFSIHWFDEENQKVLAYWNPGGEI